MGKRKGKFWSMHGTHRSTGIRYESGFEKKFLDQCYLQGIRVTRCTVVVPYRDSTGKSHTYEPDFFWPDFNYVIEIKGSWALRDNHGFVREKFFAAKAQFNGRYTLITEKELKTDYVATLRRDLTHGN